MGTPNFRQKQVFFGQITLILALFWTFLGQKFSATFQGRGGTANFLFFWQKKFCYKGIGGP